jgi:septal ring factor EnvC (AmiA/AmiB activator)
MHYRILCTFCALTIAALAPSGCSCTGNPRFDGYSCGKSAIASGAYDQRVNQKKETLEDTQDEKVQQQREIDDLQAQQQSHRQDIDNVSTELAKLDGELKALNSRIAASKANKTVNQQRLSEIQKSLNSVKRQTSLAQADTISAIADREKELQRLQAKYEALQRELLLLTGGS